MTSLRWMSFTWTLVELRTGSHMLGFSGGLRHMGSKFHWQIGYRVDGGS